MAYYPTQKDFALLRRKNKEVYTKVELLNKNYKVIDVIIGSLVHDSFSINSESVQRRTYSCDIHVANSTFLIGNDKKIWVDKYIRVYYGVKASDITWYLLGTYTYLDANYSCDLSANITLSLSCADLMADYDGTKNGEIDGYKLTIPAGEDIRESIIGLLKAAGITNYNVEDIGREIPYDLEFADTTTYCDMWKKICELYDSWEFFFDIDGRFIWRQIPTGLNEPYVLDDTVFHNYGLIINESQNNTFQNIYNVTEVWGKVLELNNEDRFCFEGITYTNNIYRVTLSDVTSLDNIDNLTKIALTIPAANLAEAKVQINSFSPLPIVRDDGSPIEKGALQANTTYVFMYRRVLNGSVQNALYLLGQYQAYGIYKETNPDCPFSIGNLGYEIKHRVNYDNLYSDDLCFNQAEYLTYQTTAMLDTINLECVFIPWLDVNQKIQYTSLNSHQTNQYIIKEISWSTSGGTMQLTLYRFLESFSYVKNRRR